MVERRAICETCGHTQEWHDRDAVRARLRTEPPIDRPCYREVGGAACRCGGFRDSGEVASPASTAGRPATPMGRRIFLNGMLTLLLVVMGLALLYAYRSQTPSIPAVSVTQAIQDINAGRVRAVTISGSRATLDLANGAKELTTVAEPDTILAKAVQDYNAANPGRPIELRYVAPETSPFSVIGSIVLSLLPVLLIGGFFFYLMRERERRR